MSLCNKHTFRHYKFTDKKHTKHAIIICWNQFIVAYQVWMLAAEVLKVPAQLQTPRNCSEGPILTRAQKKKKHVTVLVMVE